MVNCNVRITTTQNIKFRKKKKIKHRTHALRYNNEKDSNKNKCKKYANGIKLVLNMKLNKRKMKKLKTNNKIRQKKAKVSKPNKITKK